VASRSASAIEGDPAAGSGRPRQASRRTVLRTGLRAGLAAAALPLAGPLAGCDTTSAGAPATASYVSGPTPERPMLWPVAADNRPIANGLRPEKGVTLRIFSWSDYVDPAAIRSFQNTYGVPVSVNSFSDAAAALEKIADPANAYDLYFPNARQITDLMTRQLLRPLNQSYLTNMSRIWPTFQNPFYDQQWRYTVPYTVYSAGISWRSDVAKEDVGARANPFDVFWDPRYRDQVSVVDNYREVLALPLLRARLGINTGRPADLALVRGQLTAMNRQTRPRRSITDFSDVATGTFKIVQAWSGDVINALDYLPAGTNPNVLRYWSPSDGRAQAENDTMVVPRGGRAPVAAHLFMNHLLDPAVALKNFATIGYQPPQNSITNATMINSGFIPTGLAGVIVEPQSFATSQRLLSLDEATDQKWRAIWKDFWDIT
jgi:spermidine/putrescine transport system substrate-binding protein